ncbi:MAG: FHA domain-containing protein [Clostridiales bacterium]|nr:FHA domain-containing protein [Clostridiales bacterium]
MNVEYMRTAKKSYMIVKGANFPYEKYELKMIMHNDISCLLQFQLIKTEGGAEYWYEVGGLQSMRNIFIMNPVGNAQIKMILSGIMEMKSAMEEYLLDDESISFPADMIYYDRVSDRIKFCYVPGLGNAGEETADGISSAGMRTLFEEILKYLDHGDQIAVRMGYEMYDRCVRGPFMVSDCIECMNLADNDKPGRVMTYGTPGRPAVSDSIMSSAPPHPMGIRDRDLSWMEERKPASDVFKDEDDDMEFLWDSPEEQPGHKKKKHRGQEKKAKKDNIKKENIKKGVIEKEAGLKDRRKSLRRERLSVEEPVLPMYSKDILEDDEGEVGATQFLSPDEAVKSWELAYRGEGIEEDVHLNNFPFVVGSDPSRSNGVLKARTVSRVHARLYTEDDRLFVEDFNSTNGTYVNNNLIPMNTPTELKDGDRIVFATEEYMVWCRRC